MLKRIELEKISNLSSRRVGFATSQDTVMLDPESDIEVGNRVAQAQLEEDKRVVREWVEKLVLSGEFVICDMVNGEEKGYWFSKKEWQSLKQELLGE